MTERAALRALARAWGVQLAYRDNDGRRRTASDDALLAVLGALGVDVAAPRQAARRLAERERALAARPIEPVLVAWEGRLAPVTIRVPRTTRRVRCRLIGEDGTTSTWDAGPDALGASDAPAAPGRRAVLVAPPARLPLGVHRLLVEETGAEATVFAAPRRAWSPGGAGRAWGVFAPLYGLHSRRSLGVGDVADLARLADHVGALGGELVGTLPLLAAFLDEPFEPSPYAPVSRLFWNELYVDVRGVAELADAPAARRLLASTAMRRALARLRRGRLVDHREAMRHKRRLLEALAAVPLRAARREAFETFLATTPAALDYARYRAAVETRGTTWPAWRGAARDGRLAIRSLDARRVRHHLYVQWLADDQLRSVGEPRDPAGDVGLYLDLPLGVHGGGYDTWRERDAFALGVDAGAPPDPFFSGGQSWGFPPLHPERVRAAGYRYPRAYVRHHMRVARALRLDHVMGLHRLFWVPHGVPATEGVYVRQHPEEWYALLTLESHRQRCEIVGENLGTVPAAVNAAMARHGLLRMHVVQFEIDPTRRPPLRPASRDSLACLETHDMHPFAGWWAGRDLDDAAARGLLAPAAVARERRGRATMRRAVARALGCRSGDVAAVVAGALADLGAGPARIVLASLEDLWLETEPQNVPGTVDGANWRRRLRLGLERLAADATVRRVLAALDEARRLRGRTRRAK